MHEFFPMFITQVWQVTLLAVAVWIVTKLFCKRRPHLGHALWLLVLIKCVVPPVFSSQAGVYSWLLTKDAPVAIADRIVEPRQNEPVLLQSKLKPSLIDRSVTPPIVATKKTLPPPATTFRPSTSAPLPKVTVLSPVPKAPSARLKPARPAQRPVVASMPTMRLTSKRTVSTISFWHSWIVKIWLGGAALFLAITILRVLRFQSWLRRQSVVEATDIESQVQTLAKQLGLRRKVRIKVVDAEFGPAAIGLLRPTIVLPQSIVADKTAEQLEPVLGHELVHLRRGDIYWSVLQTLACSLMWFHPLVWLASRNVTRESEKCCDEETIANFQCDRANYARVLVDILEQKSRLRIAPVVPGVRPADITSSRLERIMQTNNGTCRRTPRWVWAITLLIAVTVIPGAAIVQSQESDRQSSHPVAKTAPPVKRAFQSNDARWQLASEADKAENTTIQERARAAFGRQNDTFSSGFNSFDSPARQARFEANVAELTKDKDELKKILEELKEDKFWQSINTWQRLQNCKKPSIDLEVRFAKLPATVADKLFDSAEMIQSPYQPECKFGEQQISPDQLEELVAGISKTDDASISAAKHLSLYGQNQSFRTPSAQIARMINSGLGNMSILDPENVNFGKTEHFDGAFLFGKFSDVEEDSIAFSGNCNFQSLEVSHSRKLPLKLGKRDMRIETPNVRSFQNECSWTLPLDQVQVVRLAIDNAALQMLMTIKVSTKPALVAKDKGLTLEHVLKIKENLKEKLEADREPLPTPESEVAVSDDSTTKPKPQALDPLSLLLQCGESEKKRSLNTKIGLADDATLTIEGEVESQQISVQSVKVNGKNFVFKNEKADSFSCKADSGSLSFNRTGPLEDTLRLSLRTNATLQFAGVEFAANSIECFPDRIEANGNVKVSIPEISSKVTAGRVIMNLKSLAFDFDENVKVERSIDGDSFPFLVKGNHVGWSLVTGEMQTDVRHSSPNRNAGGAGGFGSFPNRGSSAFVAPAVSMPQRVPPSNRFGSSSGTR
ncbi:M56 family metallopeptidase [Mariniblastus fucicola]|nr:M56 family metallopeptidase [Mariniblastus fucicola]